MGSVDVTLTLYYGQTHTQPAEKSASLPPGCETQLRKNTQNAVPSAVSAHAHKHAQ
jgi:hypothetical protein